MATTIRVTYYALQRIAVGDDFRNPGDLVPEASEWRWLSGYLAEGKIAPVLVVSLPQEVQDMLGEWEASQTVPADEEKSSDKGDRKKAS